MAKNSKTSSAQSGPVQVGENVRFEELGPGCHAFSADGCTNSGIVVGDRGVLIIDGQATQVLAKKVLRKVKDLTDKPIRVVALTHFHADSSLGANGFKPWEIIASDLTRRMIDTRGADDILVSRQRAPEVFADLPVEPSVCEPTMTMASSMSIDLGGIEVRLMHLGRGHTMGDVVAWVPSSGVLFAGDLVQTSAAPYCGDAHMADWPRALDRITAFRPKVLMPGKGRIATGETEVAEAIETTRDFVTSLSDAASACVAQGLGLRDTFLAVHDALSPQFGSLTDYDVNLPFSAARAYDEALGLDQPQIWTLERSADLMDAIGLSVEQADLPAGEIEGDAVSSEDESALETAGEELAAEESPPEDAPEDAPEDTLESDEASDLVSDTDFAASIALTPEDLALAADETDGQPADEDAAEEGTLEEGTDGNGPDKVLEEAR